MLLGFFQDSPACESKRDPTSRTLPSFPAPAPTPQFALVISMTSANSSLGHINGPCVSWLFSCSCPHPWASATVSSLEGSSLRGPAPQRALSPPHRALSPHRGQCPRVSRTSSLAATVGDSLCPLRCQEPPCAFAEAPASWLTWPARQPHWPWGPQPVSHRTQLWMMPSSSLACLQKPLPPPCSDEAK